MKNDRDFLAGVYSKAEELRLQNNINKTTIKRSYYKYSSIAALIIIIPMLYFINSSIGYREIPQTNMIRTFREPSSYFSEADFIIVGETKEIGKSTYIEDENYIYTDITISPDEVFLGDIEEQEIILRVNGGRDKKEKVQSPLDGEFDKGKRSLLFLVKSDEDVYHLLNGKDSQFTEVEDNIFIDKLGNKYNLQEVKDNIRIGED